MHQGYARTTRRYKVYAVVAPSISSQFTYAKLGQVITAIRQLGFYHVVEAALGADMVAYAEAKELAEKGNFLTSSCCPAFVAYIEKNFPALKEHVSHNLSPAATIAKYLKETDPDCKVVFIGPCTAKKMEFQKPEVRPYIDSVMTFEELQALIDSRELEVVPPCRGGRTRQRLLLRPDFCPQRRAGRRSCGKRSRSSGLEDFALKVRIACDGIEACRMALLKASKGILPNNFIEGMACNGGCIGGAGCLTHEEKDKTQVDKYGQEAMEKTISDAIGVL